MEISYPRHPHPLTLINLIGHEDYKLLHCSLCQKRLDRNPFYACVDCKFYIHKSCANLPVEIQHHFHQPHLLSLCLASSFACDSCHKTFHNEVSFGCSACDFYLDVKCALMSDIDTEEKESIRHFTHQHPLTICSKDADTPLNCFACKQTSSDLIYGCTPCVYFLHKSCSKLPTHVFHAMHLQHALSLRVKYGKCDYCAVYNHTWKYSCSICDFYLDVSCLIASAKEAQNSERPCFLCGKQHLDSASCINSVCFINQSCIQLPEEIEHKFHSHKPLLLLVAKDFWCDSCHKWFPSQSSYGCEECDFQMDVKCSLMPSIQDDKSEESIQLHIPPHFNHHPLHLMREVYDINCSACQTTKISPIYGCLQCEYFPHHSCLELPTQIEHPLHDSHVLTLQPLGDFFCQICGRKYNGFSFGCFQCRFFIGTECVFEPQPTLVGHKCHNHHLCLVEKSFWNTCRSAFCQLSEESSEFERTKSYSLRCIQCDYNLHLLCGPLPCTIKHKSHLHVLTLVDSMAEDDSDDQYCDTCEEIRNPRLCVYYCKDCKFISHVHCVLSEIINSMKKSLEKVELRIGRDFNHTENIELSDNNVTREKLTLMDLLNSLSEGDLTLLEWVFPGAKLYVRDENATWIFLEHKSSSEEDAIDIMEELSLYNDDIFLNIENRLKCFKLDTKFHIQQDECELPIVEVKGYKVTSNFVSLFRALLMKHGDIGYNNFRAMSNVRSILLYFLCRVLSDMRRTYIADITEKQLFTWFYYLDRISKFSFDLSFVGPLRERVMRSYFGLRAMNFENEAVGRLDCEIVNVDKKIFELKTKREELEKHRQQHKSGKIAEESAVMRELITEAKKLKWERAGDGFF